MWWDTDDQFEDTQAATLPVREIFRRIFPFIRPYLKLFLTALLLSLAGVIFVLIQPLILRQIIDNDIPSGQFSAVVRSGFLYLGTMAGSALVAFFAHWLAQKAGVFAVNDLKGKLFSHLLKLGLPVLENEPTGKLVSRVESDPQRIIALTSTMSQQILLSLGMLTGALIVLATVDLRLFAVAGTVLPLIVLGAILMFKFLRPYYREERARYAKVTGVVAEFVKAAPILQIFNRLHWAHRRLDERVLDFNRFSGWLGFTNYGIFRGLMFFEVVATVLVLWNGAHWIEDGTMTVGTLVLFAQYIAQIAWPIYMFTEQLAEIQRAGGAADRIFSTLDTAPSIQSPAKPHAIPGTIESLAFEHVNFEYDADKPIIRDVSFQIYGGQSVAFVGPTGGGKTTLINLLCRLRDPTGGRILLNGTDIREYDPHEYRRLFGLVLQDLYLFPVSVLENLKVFRNELPDENVIEAAKIAGIHTTISHRPDGYDAILAERGGDLSYGQRQLLAFARALAVNPDILVLDEATSSVDPGTEQRIQRTLESLITGRTSFIVAHRLSTIRQAHQIFYVENGAILERGNHDELMARQGAYYKLVMRQTIHHPDGETV
ncbi:MAG: ABC transporter ATP-binding protein/permease [Candidatus Marinimicrobia bacterium]|nr:ABC transporter ATP-binding protein/permease [Candidatus Neomarinimicrobiota bacterium]MCF7902265.1 ABC transporter ATP-binding protein/permease [Candidatus Neomarinimicrobiota bacterium]